jgi:molybdate/tungstate transport system permease protein
VAHRTDHSRSADPAKPSPRGQSWFTLALAFASSLLILLIAAPLVGLVLTSSANDLGQAVRDPEVVGSIQLTLAAAGLAAVACSFGGIPLAYLLSRRRFRGRATLLALLDLPIVIPHSAAGIALLTVIGRRSPLGQLLDRWGIGLVGEIGGIALAMAFVSLPFLVNTAREGFDGVPHRLENVARTLGASPGRVFFTVSLPMSWRSILSGLVLMWGRGISEFGAVIIIAYHPMVTPVLVYQRFNDYGLGSAQAVAVLLVAVCVTIFAVLRWVARPGEDQHRA